MANKRAEVIDLVLAPNPDAVDSVDVQGNTALHYAAMYCNPISAKRLIFQNPDVATHKNFKDQMPIHKAFSFIHETQSRLRWKQLELVRIILDENPETVSQRDKKGRLPLHLAVHFDSAIEIIEAVYSIYPTAALIADLEGHLPIHFTTNATVQRLLLGASKPLQQVGITSSFAQFSV